MSNLAYTLVAEGASDRALLPILDWLLDQSTSLIFQPQWPDLRQLRQPVGKLADRIRVAIELQPCDLLFVHRDADHESRDYRVRQIRRSLRGLASPPAVCVVPVRMTEAWLLFDEPAIRFAAGNPHGTDGLGLPVIQTVEAVAEPKRVLAEALRRACGLSGRRLKRWSPGDSVHRLSRLIGDYSPLRNLPAFRSLEQELLAILKERGWS